MWLSAPALMELLFGTQCRTWLVVEALSDLTAPMTATGSQHGVRVFRAEVKGNLSVMGCTRCMNVERGAKYFRVRKKD